METMSFRALGRRDFALCGRCPLLRRLLQKAGINLWSVAFFHFIFSTGWRSAAEDSGAQRKKNPFAARVCQSKLKTEPRQDSPFQDRPAVVRFAGRFATVPFLLLPILGWACGPAPGCASNPEPFGAALGSRRYWISHRPLARPFHRGRWPAWRRWAG